MQAPPTILLVDDHAMFRTGLRLVLRGGMPLAQLLEAASLEEALQVATTPPTLVLLDIKLQGLNGLECIALFKREWPDTPVVMLSSQDEPDNIQRALTGGATAFVSKAETADAIIAVIRKVLDRNQSPDLLAAASADAAAVVKKPILTPRQCEVLNLLSQGLPNKTIGRRLELSENTVRWHVQSLLAVLEVSSRSEAIFVALRSGLIG